MATVRTANAHWEGSLVEGAGTVALSTTGLAHFDVTWAARSQDTTEKTSPEELLGAAHAACYSRALAARLAKAGAPPQELDTQADVTFQPGEGITGIVLTTRVHAHGISEEDFAALAEDAKLNCPVSQALTGTVIALDAALVHPH
jgi:osmotically inducible protein OsmC